MTSWLTGFGFNLSALYQIFWKVAHRSWCCCSDGRQQQDRRHCWKRLDTDTDGLHASLLYSASSFTATQSWHFHLHWLKPTRVTHSSSWHCPLRLIALCAGSLCVCDRVTPQPVAPLRWTAPSSGSCTHKPHYKSIVSPSALLHPLSKINSSRMSNNKHLCRVTKLCVCVCALLLRRLGGWLKQPVLSDERAQSVLLQICLKHLMNWNCKKCANEVHHQSE